MVELRIVRAAERMDRLTYSYETEWKERATDIGAYVCPFCSQSVEFRTQHFLRHEQSEHSNLTEEWARAFTDFRPLRRAEWEFYLDFHCPGCEAPVRVLYQAGGEWAMGCHEWSIVGVIEVSAWQPKGGANASDARECS